MIESKFVGVTRITLNPNKPRERIIINMDYVVQVRLRKEIDYGDFKLNNVAELSLRGEHDDRPSGWLLDVAENRAFFERLPADMRDWLMKELE